MGRTTEWHNVEMELVIELTPELVDTMTPDVQESLTRCLPLDWQEETPIDVHIEFKSSGYSDPGRWGSCPDDSQAPEGEDQREMDAVYLMSFPTNVGVNRSNCRANCKSLYLPHERGGEPIELPRELQESLFDHFQKQVDDEELPDLDD